MVTAPASWIRPEPKTASRLAAWAASLVTLIILLPLALFALVVLPRPPWGPLLFGLWALVAALWGAGAGLAASIARDRVARDDLQTDQSRVATRAGAAGAGAVVVIVLSQGFMFVVAPVVLLGLVAILPLLCARWSARFAERSEGGREAG